MSLFHRLASYIVNVTIKTISEFVIDVMHGGIWEYKQIASGSRFKRGIYNNYTKKRNCFIGLRSHFADIPIFPHGLDGIYISNGATIGKKCVIFQQVTIGSNTLNNHPRFGSPTIGDNVYIGAGAKIIGRVSIGNNCRIGANAVVTCDLPANTTAVCASTRLIAHKEIKENSFTPLY